MSKKASEKKSRKSKPSEDSGTNQAESSKSAVQDDDVENNEVPDSKHSDEEGDPSELVHESLTGGQPKGKGKHVQNKFTPLEETSEKRDLRTIFVGNVAVEVMKSKVCIFTPFSLDMISHMLQII